jgi:hypothetical protein
MQSYRLIWPKQITVGNTKGNGIADISGSPGYGNTNG